MRFKITFAIALLLISLSAIAQEKKELRVLFVGNSFTYFHNLPQLVNAMASVQGATVITRQSTVGGSNLEQHWKKERGTRTMRLLDSAKWDYVIFNNHSSSAIDTPESFFEYGKKFAEHVKSKGGKPVFMMTWAYKSNPLMYAPIRDAYIKLGKEVGADVVPCGDLFEQVRKLRPELPMYFDDKHPSPNGTYMLSLAFTKYFTRQKLDKMPARITTRDKDNELLYLVFMTDEDADFLKQLVNNSNF